MLRRVASGARQRCWFIREYGQYLRRREVALQDEARDVLDELDLERRLGNFGSMLLASSFISGLMVWRELDIMFLGGPALSPTDILAAVGRLVLLPGIVRFDYTDERGPRSQQRRHSRNASPISRLRRIPGPAVTPVFKGLKGVL